MLKSSFAGLAAFSVLKMFFKGEDVRTTGLLQAPLPVSITRSGI